MDGYVIGWVVQWLRSEESGRRSITSWVGQYVHQRGKPVIETLWYLSEEVEHLGHPEELWNSVNVGADRFVKI